MKKKTIVVNDTMQQGCRYVPSTPAGRNFAADFRRHVRRVRRHCEPGDVTRRPRQRQALQHWAHDSHKI